MTSPGSVTAFRLKLNPSSSSMMVSPSTMARISVLVSAFTRTKEVTDAGEKDGPELGNELGVDEGLSVGTPEGSPVGAPVGPELGHSEGLTDGTAVVGA